MDHVKLIWSERALKEYEDLLDYLMEKWGEKITRQVIAEVTHQIIRIETTPEQFPIIVKRRNIRRCVISPQTSIFFKASKNVCEIYSIFDNRQDPAKR